MAKKKSRKSSKEEVSEEVEKTEELNDEFVEVSTDEDTSEHIEENVEEKVSESETPEETNEPEKEESEGNTIDIVYLGISEKATVVGSVTGIRYEFYKDIYGMPTATSVDEQDSSAILALQGKACCGKDPNHLFALKSDWDVELEQAKRVNQ